MGAPGYGTTRRVVTLVSKRGCHLCEKVQEVLNALSSEHDFEVRVLDIDDDPRLHDRYWLEVPVVQVDGRDIFDAKDLGRDEDYRRKLESLLR